MADDFMARPTVGVAGFAVSLVGNTPRPYHGLAPKTFDPRVVLHTSVSTPNLSSKKISRPHLRPCPDNKKNRPKKKKQRGNNPLTLFFWRAKMEIFAPKKKGCEDRKKRPEKNRPLLEGLSASNNLPPFTMSTTSLQSSSSGGPTTPPQQQPPTIQDNNGQCATERYLAMNSNKLSVLFALCIGLEETIDDDTGLKVPLMDLNEDAFKSLKKKKDIKPSLDILREEVKRRSDFLVQDGNKPKPNGWSITKCQDWLKANPITTDADVSFLVKRAKAIKQVVANATQTTVSPANPSSVATENGNKWYGPLPYLRLIHCLLEDDIKEKWIHRDRPLTIQEIDARRSDIREDTVFETIAARWNSSLFNPTTMVSNCHYDFSEEIDVGFDATSEFARASPTKVKDKLAKMKAALSSIIHKWERSGQGDGGRIDEEDEDDEEQEQEQDSSGDNPQGVTNVENSQWGRSEGRQGAFDCRESFLGPNPSYLLYFWDVLDQNNLFYSTTSETWKK